MESENFPIILRCEDASVAISIKTLIQESTIFKTLYESVELNSSALSESGRDSGCSLQDIQDLPSDDSNDGINKTNGNLDNRSESGKEEETVDKDNKLSKETSNKHQNQRLSQQFDTIDLSNFNGKSVRILFNSIQGHPELIDACNSLSDLFDVLKLCDEYGISSPLSKISTRFKTCDTISMVNLIQTMQIAEDVEKLNNYENISNELIQRCVSFARWNFASWQVVMNLIMENKDKVHLVIRILKKLRDECEATVRFKVDSFSQLSDSKTSSIFIIRNLSWKINVYQYKDSQGKKMIGIKIHCKNPNNDDGWYCDAKVKLRIANHSTQQDVYEKEIENKFKKGAEDLIITEFKPVEAVLNYSNGFIKEDQVVFEAKMSADYVCWTSESLGISEKDMGWFEKKICDSIRCSSELKELNLNEIEDAPVIVSCEKTIVAVHKFVLIKESSVFQAMFTGLWTLTRPADESSNMDENVKVIELTGYNQLSVKYLFEYLKGYPTLLKDCKDISVIGDMMKLCDFYDIKRPIPELLAKISNLQVNMKNVVKAFEASRNLEMIVAYKDLSSNLFSKCISYVRFNLASWQVLNNFLVSNSSKIDMVIKIIEILVQTENGNIRFKTTEINNETNDIQTPLFIHRNILWGIYVKNKENVDKKSFIACYVWCKQKEENISTQICTCSATFVVKLHKVPTWEAAKTWQLSKVTLIANSNGWGNHEFISNEELRDVNNGYLKDGSSYFEFDLSAYLPSGIPQSLGVTEEMII